MEMKLGKRKIRIYQVTSAPKLYQIMYADSAIASEHQKEEKDGVPEA